MSAPVAAAQLVVSRENEIDGGPRSRGALSLPSRTYFALIVLAIAVWAVYLVVVAGSPAVDAHAYFVADLGHLYSDAPEGARDAYVYTPAFAQLVEPLRWLGEAGFVGVWRVLETGALLVLTGPLAAVLLFVQPFGAEVAAGNIHILFALAIVAGFRWPAAWSFVLLTKVTPGVGLLWFAVRREWRSLAIALGVTAAIAGVSFVVDPGAWFAWLTMLTHQSTPDTVQLVAGPLVLRLAAAAALVAWGARTDRRWTALVAAFVALPVTWFNAASMFAGLLPLIRRRPAYLERSGSATPTKTITVIG